VTPKMHLNLGGRLMRTIARMKTQLLLLLVLFFLAMPTTSFPADQKKSICDIDTQDDVPDTPYSAWQECLKAIELNPSSLKFKKAIGFIKDKMLVRLENRTDNYDPQIHKDFFRIDSFPKEGIVSKDNAVVYNDSLLKKKKLAKNSRIKLAGVYPFAFSGGITESGIREFHYFYKVEASTLELISTDDVAVEEMMIDPGYISPDGRAKVLRTPVTYSFEGEAFYAGGKCKLWLKTEAGKLVFLNDYYYTIWDNSGDFRIDYYRFERPISWSPDSKYLFVECSGKVFSQDGRLIFRNKKNFSSPFWHDGFLYVRGIGQDDSVYRLNPETLEFKKFIEYREGRKITPDEPSELWKECGMMSKPVYTEGGRFIIGFLRINPNTKHLEDGCLEIKAIADKSGAIIKTEAIPKSCIR
jgi:hypothetical protein